MENKKLETLKDLLANDIQYKFIDDDEYNLLLEISGLYNPNKDIYINFYKLIELLERYVGIDEILLNTDEITKEEER